MQSDASACVSQTNRSGKNGTHYKKDEKKALQETDRKQAEEGWIGKWRLWKQTSARDGKELLSEFIK